MADKWIDSAATGGANDGTSPANAWTNFKSAVEYGHSPGDRIFWRRTNSYSAPASTNVYPYGIGTPAAPIQLMGWPRGPVTGTATFTNGSDTVTSVSITITLRAHGGRWVKCDADGHWYLITRYVSASSFKIDRPYGGATASGAAFTIAEDEDYAARPSAGYGWDADTQNLPQIYPTTANYYALNMGGSAQRFWWIKNIYFYRSTNGGLIVCGGSHLSLQGVVFSYLASYAATGYSIGTDSAELALHLRRFLIAGPTVACTATGIYMGSYSHQQFTLKDGAINGVNTGIYYNLHPLLSMENVNIGVEQTCGNACLRILGKNFMIIGKDVKLYHATESRKWYFESAYPAHEMYSAISPFNMINIENYNKDRSQIYRHAGQLYTSKAVDSSTTDPRIRTNGSSVVIVADLSTGGTSWGPDPRMIPCSVFDQRIFQLGGSNKSYRIYLQSTVAIASGLIVMEVEFMDFHSSATLWTETNKTGTAAISARSGNTDWSQYIEVTGINPPEDCAVRIKLYCSAYSDSNFLYIDPKVVVS